MVVEVEAHSEKDTKAAVNEVEHNQPDEDELEEFEEIGRVIQETDSEVQGWKSFSQTTWDDADLDDEFCNLLEKELRAFKLREEPHENAAARNMSSSGVNTSASG